MATTPESVVRNEKEKLIGAVKKEVKQIMEEAVTRKFVHEESSSITSLCAIVEECLHNGLKKRALGLFKNSTTMALLQKVSKSFEPAAHIVKLVSDIENNQENKKSFDSNRNLSLRTGWTGTSVNPRYLWIRLALFEKDLAEIIEYLVQSAHKYYEKDALLSDPVHGPILASLLVGPCALEYTKMKTPDHYWTDPPADELVQRHRIHSSTNHHIRATSPKRPGLQVQVKSQTSSSSEDSLRTGPLSAKDYVESLHQNCKSTLLYGKNNVIVQPKEDVEPLAGYLSLHQGFDGLCLKWTPNQLMNGCCEEEDEQTIDRRPIYARYFGCVHRNGNQRSKLLYWDYAVTVYLDEIVYLHCHQQPDRGGTIVLVGQDGVQRPPIHFPKGGHLLAFLSCLENGLLPHGQLDPPLWTQRGKGKVFPKLRRKGSRLSNLSSGSQTSDSSSSVSIDDSSLQTDEDETTDYVFRIITTFRPDNIPTEMLDPKGKGHLGLTSGRIGGYLWPTRETAEPPATTVQPPASSSIQSYARTQQEFNYSCICRTGHRSAVKQLCDTMTKQIRSRAFYGWLSHCRHLKTVRTHLSGLVNATIMLVDEPRDASKGLTMELWNEMNQNGVVTESQELYRLVYYGGCVHEARIQVWPYLLGHYKFGTTAAERHDTNKTQRCQYEQTMSEWMAVEAIVRQRDKEATAANLVKVSQGSQDGHIPLVRKDSNLSNDVFMSVESDDYVPPETLPEESSNATSSPDGDAANSVIDVVTRGSFVQEGELNGTGDGKHTKSASDEGLGDSIAQAPSSVSDSKRSDSSNTDRNLSSFKSESDDSATCMDMAKQKNIIVTSATVDVEDHGWEDGEDLGETGKKVTVGCEKERLMSDEGDQLHASKESLVLPPSPASVASNGGVYSAELLDSMTVNLHRIDKDVQRCDRNYCYFTPPNLDKLRNIMCTYVWENLDVGYIQGMCDLVAPLLVIFDDEAMTYSCFCHLMKRMSSNFPHGGAMDQHFANMRSLIQILDPELFEHMHQNGDYTHFYFCYRWFLLDFKRELLYDDVFAVWETVWAARYISSPHFVLFIALALVEYYREIIIDNNMDFTDIIKFFNEMAERHNVKQVLRLARDLVHKLQDLIDNK